MDGRGNPSFAWLSALGGAVLLATFLFTVREFLTPIVGFVALVVFYFALRDQPATKPIFVAAVAVFVLWLLAQVGDVLLPFVASLALAYLLRPAVAQLEKWRLPRAAASAIVLALLLAIMVVAGIFILPQLASEIGDLFSTVVASAPRWRDWIEKTIFALLARFPIDPEKLQTMLLQELPTRLESLSRTILQGALNLTGALSRVAGQVVNVILVPVLTYYFLKDFQQGQEAVLARIPPTRRARVLTLVQRADELMSGFLRGQLLVMLAVGVLTAFGLSLAGVPYALFLGAVTGLLNVIPYLGLYASLGLALVVALFSAEPLGQAIRVVVVFVIVQGLEGAVLSPKIVGDRVGLHPVWVIMSVFVAAHFLGFAGLILGVPLAALVKVLLTFEWRPAVVEK